MAKFLFEVQQKNRLEQKGLLRRFSIICYGHQESVEEMRAEKAKKFKELKDKKGSREFEEWFLNYKPGQGQNIQGTKNVNVSSKKTKDDATYKDESKDKTKYLRKKTFKFKSWRNKTRKNNEIY
jgi:hypothetical protein